MIFTFLILSIFRRRTLTRRTEICRRYPWCWCGCYKWVDHTDPIGIWGIWLWKYQKLSFNCSFIRSIVTSSWSAEKCFKSCRRKRRRNMETKRPLLRPNHSINRNSNDWWGKISLVILNWPQPFGRADLCLSIFDINTKQITFYRFSTIYFLVPWWRP